MNVISNATLHNPFENGLSFRSRDAAIKSNLRIGTRRIIKIECGLNVLNIWALWYSPVAKSPDDFNTERSIIHSLIPKISLWHFSNLI